MPNRKARRAAARVSSLTSYAEVAAPAPAEVQEPPALARYWEGVIGVEGTATGDGRLIEEGALEWDTPIPLRVVMEDTGAHDGAVVAGRILSVERGEDGQLFAYGDFDHGSDSGREAARLVQDGMMNGVSMDLDSIAFEVRVDPEVIAEQDAFWEALEAGEEPEQPERRTDEDGRVIVYEAGSSDELMVTTEGRVRAATIVSIPAFAEAVIRSVDELPAELLALIASAAPVDPPASWFSMAEANEPTPLTITDDGQVFGHLASYDTCHVADPAGAGVCVMAPKSKSGYAYFHTGAVKTEEGTQVPTGVLRFNTQHASIRASADAASAHYDHTGMAGADVHASDGKHGIWVAGALRPGLDDAQVRTLRASPLSGDWRYIAGTLELVGALAVNLPGFPIPRPQGLVASGELTGLVAAGMIAPRTSVKMLKLSPSDEKYLARLISRERTADQRAGEELSSRVSQAQDKRRIDALARKLSSRKAA